MDTGGLHCRVVAVRGGDETKAVKGGKKEESTFSVCCDECRGCANRGEGEKGLLPLILFLIFVCFLLSISAYRGWGKRKEEEGLFCFIVIVMPPPPLLKYEMEKKNRKRLFLVPSCFTFLPKRIQYFFVVRREDIACFCSYASAEKEKKEACLYDVQACMTSQQTSRICSEQKGEEREEGGQVSTTLILLEEEGGGNGDGGGGKFLLTGAGPLFVHTARNSSTF